MMPWCEQDCLSKGHIKNDVHHMELHPYSRYHKSQESVNYVYNQITEKVSVIK